ncbi:MAG: prepilin-type N-terminal cleavage/methylation domain-containing protein [Ignavibacteriales bacterium]
MKNKGFTLIELLAVIVILAIIAVIATPVIMNLIDRSRYGAFGVSKKNIERAAELYYARNAASIIWNNDISYVEIGTLKSKKYLAQNVVDVLTDMEISDDTKILLYHEGRKVSYSLQLYDDTFFDWYQKEMIKASQKDDVNLPTNVGDKTNIDLEELMNKGLVDELRLPLELENRCVGYVEIEKMGNDDYDYNAYVDCLTDASTFASHYVSYGGKYLDDFLDVKETSEGGYITVGESNSEVITKYGFGNNGKQDAIIVKFDASGNVEWGKNFGGSNDDTFYSVVEGPDGYVAVGLTTSNDIDIENYIGGQNDAIIVKYSKQGDVVYKRNYGSSSSDQNGGSEQFLDIILDGNSYVLVGTVAGFGTDGDLTGEDLVRANEGIILKMDLSFNTVWRNFFVASNSDTFRKVIKTTDNSYVVAGYSGSNDYDMAGLGFTTPTNNNEAIVLKYDSSGNLVKKESFQGSKQENFYGVVEVSDGYVFVGSSNSSDMDMSTISKVDNGYNDAIIVKYDKNLENIMWKKSFGGSDDECFYGIEKENNSEVVAVGYSKSTDIDMNNINKSSNGYSSAIMTKYNASNGNVTTTRVFGGSNSDMFRKIIKTSSNKYIVAGNTYSNNGDLKNFNKGHQDAILVGYDSNLNLSKTFQEPVIIIDKLKTITPSYGNNIILSYNNIYTSNDPTKDLVGWCSSLGPYLPGNTSNYYYGNCLVPFNPDDKKWLVEKTVGSGLPIIQGEYEYKLSINRDNNYNWHQIIFSMNGNGEFSNMKLKFADGYIGYITDAIQNGYIEPLVIVYSSSTTVRPSFLLPTVIDIINENGRTGLGSYPTLYVLVKPKKSKFSSIIMTSNANSSGTYGMYVTELRNFDMSVAPTQ